MTTAHSPLRALKAQADRVAKMLKTIERGGTVAEDRGGKIAASLAVGIVKFAIVMDDKILTIEMAWKMIRESSEAALSAYVIKLMRESREH